MRCFNHQEREAVAICKYCGKGLCPGCLLEIRSGISCKGTCEQRLAELESAFLRSTQIAATAYAKARKAYLYAAFFLGPAGLAFVGLGMFEEHVRLRFFLLMLGGILILGAFLSYLTSREYKKDMPHDSSHSNSP